MDKTLMAIQTKFTIATFIGDEKMFREAVVTNGAIVIHTQRLKSDPGGNLLS
ncbi:host cell division inhibitory peptide Kil [Escherichia coli]|uniref:host cell division inhibitory peptide Kil n=1 Tax=Escherichia coli TaxID=562 RepID=UPI0008FF8270|nr:host cell division inhibitory peptide Kil [Escherichia coli]